LLGSEGIVVLDKVFRQKDTNFQRLLNDMRRGVLTDANRAILSSRVHAQVVAGADIEPTQLYATNKGVDEINERRLKELSTDDVEVYVARDEGEDSSLQQLKNGMKAPERLCLKVGAQVMLLKNLNTDGGLVNGARGVVRGFAASKQTSIGAIRTPVVDFRVKVGAREHMIESYHLEPDMWELKQGDNVLARRTQLPLMLAWAISVHKSQGMTIPYLNVSFTGMFEFGQVSSLSSAITVGVDTKY
jgi:ATP-dependent DNA helicase PIF1